MKRPAFLTDDIAISAGREIQSHLNDLLVHRYHIAHATLQLECANCQPCLYCDMNKASHLNVNAVS